MVGLHGLPKPTLPSPSEGIRTGKPYSPPLLELVDEPWWVIPLSIIAIVVAILLLAPLVMWLLYYVDANPLAHWYVSLFPGQ